MEKIKIPETYEEFLKTPKKDILKISKMDFHLKLQVEWWHLFVKLKMNIEKKPKVESKRRKKTKTFWEDLYG